MRLEGIAEIELTNVNTGEKETIVEKNMVTNALSFIFGRSMGGLINRDFLGGWMVPIYKKALGGIYIFDENIEENPNIIVPPPNVECIGHAGNDAYAGKDGRRGSFNSSESVLIDNGVKLVWDFATNQANGVIKCISLTNELAGRSGIGSDVAVPDYNPTLFTCLGQCAGNFNPPCLSDEYWYEVTFVSSVLTIKKYKTVLESMSILDELSKYALVSETQVDISDEPNSLYEAKVCEDKILVTLQSKKNANRVNLVVIDKNSFLKLYEGPTEEVFGFNAYGIRLCKGYYYSIQSNKLFKVNENNFSDKIEIPIKGSTLYGAYADRIYTNLDVIDSNGKVLNCKGIAYFGSYGSCSYLCDDLFYYSLQRTDTLYLQMYLGYIATINNLASPIIKTSDKTMKITYTITEKAE